MVVTGDEDPDDVYSDEVALRVTLTRLRNICGNNNFDLFAPCERHTDCTSFVCESPHSQFEGQQRYVQALRTCRGGGEPGTVPCRSQEDCDKRKLDGVCEQRHTCQGGGETGGVTCGSQADCDARIDFKNKAHLGGKCLPSHICSDSPILGTTFLCATLGCEPEYRDWASELGGETLHVTGAAIVPGSSRYDVVKLDASCVGSELSCSLVSDPLTIHTSRWGTVNDHPGIDVTDVADVVDKIKDLPDRDIDVAASADPTECAQPGDRTQRS